MQDHSSANQADIRVTPANSVGEHRDSEGVTVGPDDELSPEPEPAGPCWDPLPQDPQLKGIIFAEDLAAPLHPEDWPESQD